MEGFTFDSVLDLNMGYYHITLYADTQKICTIIFQWNMEKYKYEHLTMCIKFAWFLTCFKTSYLIC
jgi:hypothetical protein